MAVVTRAEGDEFRRRLKEEWGLLWRERFDDHVRAEGVSVRDYPLVFMDRGSVIFASRNARAPSFSDIVDSWHRRGRLYAPDPHVGGWGKFIGTSIAAQKPARPVRRASGHVEAKIRGQQRKKGGRGWLHK